MPKFFHIAIDGPVAAGKSTVTKLIADKLNFTHIDTGAMYRAVALAAMRQGIDLNDEDQVAQLLPNLKIQVRPPNKREKDGRLSTVFLDGEDVSWAIRDPEVSLNVPIVAAMPKVREALVALQQQVAAGQNVVMEGRDITYKVLPDADLKIYLTASDEERINRQFARMQAQGEVDLDKAAIGQELKDRDYIDQNRVTDPLKIVPEAWVVDTSNLTIEEVVDLIVKRVIELQSDQPVVKASELLS